MAVGEYNYFSKSVWCAEPNWQHTIQQMLACPPAAEHGGFRTWLHV
jgi:hypothetical protein